LSSYYVVSPPVPPSFPTRRSSELHRCHDRQYEELIQSAVAERRYEEAKEEWTESEPDFEHDKVCGCCESDILFVCRIDGQCLGYGLEVAEPEPDECACEQHDETGCGVAEDVEPDGHEDECWVQDDVCAFLIQYLPCHRPCEHDDCGVDKEEEAGCCDEVDFYGVQVEE